jgi:NAD(P)-dependent dehydrogenase (short-subunit alcohol dehydrogenase family)
MKNRDSSPVVLVTGAAKRLGKEISLTLASGGWNVAVHFHKSEDEAEATVKECSNISGLSFKYQCDLGREEEVRALLPRVVASFGRIDAIVNNASVFEYDAVESFSHQTMQRHIFTNTGAPILLAQALHRQILRQGGTGAVVNMLDQKLWNTNPDFFSYTMS